MLVLQMTLGRRDEEVIIRDADGNILCEVMLTAIRDWSKARVGFVAPHQVKVNRRSVDESKDWSKPGIYEWPICAICHCPLHGQDADASGVAHRVCAEREQRS